MTTAPPEFAPWMGVFETLRVIDGVPLFVREHHRELIRAMKALGLASAFDPALTRRELEGRSGRWRWVVTHHEARTIFTEEVAATAEPSALSVSVVRLGSDNWDARYKTVSYLSHAQASRIGSTPEVVLLNEHGNIASTARANLFWRRGKRLFTPSHEAGCRCGVVRGFVMAQGPVEEGHFPVDHLSLAEEIFVTNSIRGIISIRAFQGRVLEDFLGADSLRTAYAFEIERQTHEGLKAG